MRSRTVQHACPQSILGMAAAVILSLSAMTLGIATPASLAAQSSVSEGDSLDLLKQAKEEQARFESYRESRIPPRRSTPDFSLCRDLIGRFCLFEGGDGSRELAVEEPIEVGMARKELLRTLTSIARDIPGDDWILGQRVFYLIDDGQVGAAASMVRRCQGPTEWWCKALFAMIYQRQGEWLRAAELFAEAFDTMPQEEIDYYHSIRFLLDRDGRGYMDSLNPEERAVFEQYLWELSDPLFLVEGNDRLVEHFARKVAVRIREEGENTWRMDWGEDMEELEIRFGQVEQWGKNKGFPNAGLSLEDNRSLVAYTDPLGLEYVPPGSMPGAPAEIPAEEWTVKRRGGRTIHVAPYAPEMNPLTTQVARFRRGDSLLVVAGYAPATVEAGQPIVAEESAPSSDPFGFDSFGPPATQGFAAPPPRAGEVQAGLILVPEGGEGQHVEEGTDPSGTFTLMVPVGRYVVGVEVYDAMNKRAWRDRHGVIQSELPFGVSALSDLVLLRGGVEPPASLDEALPNVLPSVSIRSGDEFTAAWEVYGLQVGESAEVTIGIGDAGTGFLERVGGFLGLTSDDRPVVMTWEEAAEDDRKTIFRAINLVIPELEPGDYELRLEVDVLGRTPMITSRMLHILPPA